MRVLIFRQHPDFRQRTLGLRQSNLDFGVKLN
jgi:hypothetical protein